MEMIAAAAAARRDADLQANSGLKDVVFIYSSVDIAKPKVIAALNKIGLHTDDIDRDGTSDWIVRMYTDEKGHKKSESVDWINFSHDTNECYVIVNVFSNYGRVLPHAFAFARAMAGLYRKDFSE